MGSIKTIGQVARYKPLSQLGMEELAQRQTEIKSSGGVMFARNADGEEKTAARQLVLDLFHPDKWPGPLNMFTMPGVQWRFERKLLAVRQPNWFQHSSPRGTHFTAAENDRSIYFAAVTRMPGVETPHRLLTPVKRERFPFAELAVKTRYASFFFANVDDMLVHEWTQPAYREPSMLGWTAAWLDYTGPLSIERLAAIKHFYGKYVRSTLIITALKARWNKATSNAIEKADGHANWLSKHLEGEVLHSIEYADTSPMAQFAIRKQ